MKKIFILSLILFCITLNSVKAYDFGLKGVKPKDLLDDGYKLHSVTNAYNKDYASRFNYTFIKGDSVVSCIVVLIAYSDGEGRGETECFNIGFQKE